MAIFTDPTFWVAVAFVVFAALVFKPIRQAIAGALDDKIALIRGEVEEAQRLREEAQATLASYQRQQRDALLVRLTAEADAAQARIEAETERVIGDIGTIATELAQAAASRIAGAGISREEAVSAVAAAQREAS